MNKQKIIQAGEISKKVKEYAKSIIKKDMFLLELADKIENKIYELGGKPAFPVNLSINEIAAHYTPSYDDKEKAKGLLKVDIGVHVDGWIADSAFSIDLENSDENKKIILASKNALEEVEKIMKKGVSISEIGRKVEETINKFELNPIVNLTGHSLEEYNLHAGITIPNIDNNSKKVLEKGAYAVEPFATNGVGKIKEGKPSGIYILEDKRNVRNPLAREILNYIIEEYQTLPFCSRWVVKKFGTKVLLGLRQLESEGILHQFPHLVEISGGIVSQAENTFLIEDTKTTITTK